MVPETLWQSVLRMIVWPILKYGAILLLCYTFIDIIILLVIALPLFGTTLAGAIKDGSDIH